MTLPQLSHLGSTNRPSAAAVQNGSVSRVGCGSKTGSPLLTLLLLLTRPPDRESPWHCPCEWLANHRCRGPAPTGNRAPAPVRWPHLAIAAPLRSLSSCR